MCVRRDIHSSEEINDRYCTGNETKCVWQTKASQFNLSSHFRLNSADLSKAKLMQKKKKKEMSCPWEERDMLNSWVFVKFMGHPL